MIKKNIFYQTRLLRPTLSHAQGIYLYDKDGNRYLDGSSGAMVSNIGHSNANVLKAMQEQMDKATFGYRLHFQNDPAEKLAKKLANKMPGDINQSFFVSGGSEAVESAIKLARQYMLTKGEKSRYKVISCFPSYHGCTLGALAVTGYDPLSNPFKPMMVSMPKIASPTAYLEDKDLNDVNVGIAYAEQLRKKIEDEGTESVMAFIMEPIGGATTGALVPPAGYHQAIRKICDEYNILLIYDEIMTGAARTGKFVASEHWDVVADIVTISKGLGSGYIPFGVIVAKDHIVDSVLDNGGFMHGFTYAGNPLACATGLAVVNEIDRLQLCNNASEMGGLLIKELQKLKNEFEFIGDVRGKGLLTAFEFFNRDSKESFDAELNLHSKFVEACYKNKLIVYSRRTRGGNSGDHIMICPPLIIDKNGIAEIIDNLRKTLIDFAKEIK